MPQEVVMHYLAIDDGGPIRSEYREAKQGSQTQVICPGSQCRIACAPNRSQLGVARGRGRHMKIVDDRYAFATNTMFRPSKLSNGEVVLQELVTCPKCRESKLYARDREVQLSLWDPAQKDAKKV